MKKALIDKYNDKSTLIVFSSYADQNNSAKDQNALAGYTRQMIESIPKTRKVIVLSEKTSTTNGRQYEVNDHVLILPCWEKQNLFSMFTVLWSLKKFSSVKTTLFQFEFNMFGSILGPIIIFFLIFTMKLMGKGIYFQIHQVVLDISELKNQINIKSGLKIKFFNICLHVFYNTIFFLSQKVIVTEEILATRLRTICNTKKIVVISHHVPQLRKLISRDNTKKNTTLLFFGYLSWYKGVDWLVKKFKKLKTTNPKLRLIVAGDKSPTLKNQQYYAKYYKNLISKINTIPEITLTGFILDEDIPKWFRKADMLVLPYQTFMSSSGPLSWALAFHKPVILSNKLKDYLRSPDFASAFTEAGLQEKDLFFDLSTESLEKIIKNLKKDKLRLFAKILAKKRSQKSITKHLLDHIFQPAMQNPSKIQSLLIRMQSNIFYRYAK